jgi:AbrB family looped-hinge helix DNA binding protein
MATATLTSKGQITIPVEIRRALGLKSGDRIEIYEV